MGGYGYKNRPLWGVSEQLSVKRYVKGQIWACFIYGHKCSIYFYYPKDEEEKEAAKKELNDENESRKAAIVLERLLQKNKKGNLVKKGRKPIEAVLYKRNAPDCGGIDSYRHQEQVLKPLLLPLVRSY